MKRSMNACPARKHLILPVLFALMAGLSYLSHGNEIIRNGGFDGGLAEWVVPDELKGWTPYDGNGRVQLDFNKAHHGEPVVVQNVNIPVSGPVTVNYSIAVEHEYSTSWGKTCSISLWGEDTGGVFRELDKHDVPFMGASGQVHVYASPSGTVIADAVRFTQVRVALPESEDEDYVLDTIDNCSVTVSPDVTPGELPVLNSVRPYQADFGEDITLSGSGFGASGGKVFLNGSEEGITIVSWADDEIHITLGLPAADGHLTVETAEYVQTSGVKGVQIITPHYVINSPIESVMAISGQTITGEFILEMKNGYLPPTPEVVSLSCPGEEHSGKASFSPASFTTTDGGRMSYNTTGMAPGVYTIPVRATGPNIGPYNSEISLTVFDLDHIDLYYANPYTKVTSIDETAQRVIDTEVQLINGEGQQIPSYLNTLHWTSDNVSVCEVAQRGQWDLGPKILPQSSGTCTLTAHGPGGFTANYPVTITIDPGDDQVTGITANNNPVPNDNSTICRIEGYANTNFDSYMLWGIDWNVVDSSSLSDTNIWIDLTAATGAVPGGEHVLELSAGTATRGYIMMIGNSSSTAMMSGVIRFMDEEVQHYTAGTMNFYNAVTGLLVHQVVFGHEGWHYTAASLPPGNYKIQFVPEDAAYPAFFYPMVSSFEDAATVSLTAGNTTDNIHFFVRPASAEKVKTLPKPTYNGSEFTVNVGNTMPGMAYVVEVSDTMAEGSWTVLAEFSGDGEARQVVDDMSGKSRRFYRVRQL
jgi:hypothetical protein